MKDLPKLTFKQNIYERLRNTIPTRQQDNIVLTI